MGVIACLRQHGHICLGIAHFCLQRLLSAGHKLADLQRSIAVEQIPLRRSDFRLHIPDGKIIRVLHRQACMDHIKGRIDILICGQRHLDAVLHNGLSICRQGKNTAEQQRKR